jgi:hypothetical protein
MIRRFGRDAMADAEIVALRAKLASRPRSPAGTGTGTEFAAASSTGSATATSSDRTQCTLLSTKGEPTRRRQIAEALGRVRI